MTIDQMIKQLQAEGLTVAGEIMTDEEGYAFLVHMSERNVRRRRQKGQGARSWTAARRWYELVDIETFMAAGGYAQYEKESRTEPDNSGHCRTLADTEPL